MKTRVRLFRHGYPEGDDSFRGAGEWKITQEGFADMAWVSRSFPEFDVIITPEASRCKDFAAWFSERVGVPVVVEKGLRERYYGDWDSRLKADVEKESPELFKRFNLSSLTCTPPDGEAPEDYSTRIVKVVTALLKTFEGKRILVITHGGVMRQIVGHFLNLPLEARGKADMDFPYASWADLILNKTDEGLKVEFQFDPVKQEQVLYPTAEERS